MKCHLKLHIDITLHYATIDVYVAGEWNTGRYDGKRLQDQPAILHGRLTSPYKQVLRRLAYGEFTTKRHMFGVAWLPWGLRRSAQFVVRVASLIPVVHVCLTTFMFDAKIFDADAVERRRRDASAAAEQVRVSA